MLGVFWGLLSQWGDKTNEEVRVEETTEPEKPVKLAKTLNPSQKLAQAWVNNEVSHHVIIKNYDLVRKNESLSIVLDRNGISPVDIHHLSRSLKGVFDVRTVRPGREVILERDRKTGLLHSFTYTFRGENGAPSKAIARRLSKVANDDNAPRFKAVIEDTPIITKPVSLSGKVQSTLYESLIDAGGNAYLVNRFADVFNWDIDFYREVQNGDTFKVITEKKYANGEFVGFGRVVAAEYVNLGRELRGYYFESQDEKVRGYFDNDGYLFISGRNKDLIISGGYNVYPKEIEDIINQHELVLESAVFGIPNDDLGEVPIAAIVMKNNSTDLNDLKDFLKKHLVKYKIPYKYILLDELPKNVMGKVQKNTLKEKYS